jgi:hypothetical protein
MPSPLHGLKPPFTLPSNIVYFHDWRYVYAGNFGWLGPAGDVVPLYGTEPVPPMHMKYQDIPLGIHLVAQPARKTDPVMTAEGNGEASIGAVTCIYEQGRYRMWYEGSPAEIFTGGLAGSVNLLRYAESDDGVDWKRPSLGVVEFAGSRNNNIVYGGPVTPAGYHGGSVFLDPSAPSEERYKIFHCGDVTEDCLARFREQRPDDVDPFHLDADPFPAAGLFGGVSPDGLHFTPIAEPLVVQTSDTHNVCTYNVTLGKYVAYVRSWYLNRRTIGRMEAHDFRRFPLPEELFWPNGSTAPYESWYSSAKTIVPGTTDYHVMFPLCWSMAEDRLEFHLAASPDDLVWNFVPGGPVCVPGPPGAWDQGVVVPGLGLVPLPGDRMGILYVGIPFPHKYPRRPPWGAFGWAWWPKGRLVALRAPLEGSFALWYLRVNERTVRLNFRTRPTGHVQVEVLGPERKVLPGRRFDDCGYLTGDHLDHLVTWRGEPDLGHPEGAPILLRFRLRSADLFSVEFR